MPVRTIGVYRLQPQTNPFSRQPTSNPAIDVLNEREPKLLIQGRGEHARDGIVEDLRRHLPEGKEENERRD